MGSFFIEGNAKKEKLVSKSDKSESKIDNKDKKESKSVTNEEKTSKKDAIKSLETKKEVKKDKTELSNEKSESKKSMDIEIEGMVEVSSLQKNQTEGISVWTVFPLEMDVEGKKTLKNTHQMMRLNGTLVQKSGKTTFKVKSYKLLDD